MQGPGPKTSHSWSDSKDSASFRVVHCPVCGQRDTSHLLISVCARPTPHAVMEDLSLGEAKGPAQEPSAGERRDQDGRHATRALTACRMRAKHGRALTACRMRAEHGPSTPCVPDAGRARAEHSLRAGCGPSTGRGSPPSPALDSPPQASPRLPTRAPRAPFAFPPPRGPWVRSPSPAPSLRPWSGAGQRTQRLGGQLQNGVRARNS